MKRFLMKKMLSRQLKKQDVPAAQREQLMALVENNPELFEKIGKEVQQEVKKGRDQMAATMEVMKRHQDELRKAMGQ